MKKNQIAFLVVLAIAAMAPAASFSINVGTINISGTDTVGPLSTEAGNWYNAANSGSGTGALTQDDSGAAFGTAPVLTFSSSGTWNNNGAWGTQDEKINNKYLDDGTNASGTGGSGVMLTITNIPYANYRVYGLLSSGQVQPSYEYVTRNFYVNTELVFGGDESTTALAYGDLASSNAATGLNWSPISADGTVRGNYWTYETTGSTLTVDGLNRNGVERGSLAGLVIEEVPEPATMSLLALGGVAMLRRRKK